jgi:hypothetical protein
MRAALTNGIARSQWLSLSQAAHSRIVGADPGISPRTPLESRSFSSLRDGVLLPIGRVVGGLFSFVGLRVHAPILFRSPKKDDANSYESVFLFRAAS